MTFSEATVLIIGRASDMSAEAMKATLKALSVKDKLRGIRELFSVEFLDSLTCSPKLRVQQTRLLVDVSILLHIFVWNPIGQKSPLFHPAVQPSPKLITQGLMRTIAFLQPFRCFSVARNTCVRTSSVQSSECVLFRDRFQVLKHV